MSLPWLIGTFDLQRLCLATTIEWLYLPLSGRNARWIDGRAGYSGSAVVDLPAISRSTWAGIDFAG
jgi:hypothetical protein